jgi:ribonucleoside-diphosphate reductase alpha chain
MGAKVQKNNFFLFVSLDFFVTLSPNRLKEDMDTQKSLANEAVIQALLVAYGGEERLLNELLKMDAKSKNPIKKEQLTRMADHLRNITPVSPVNLDPHVTEIHQQSLECDVVRFQNNKEKWVALVGLLDGYPYEIFTGLQDDDEGIVLPKSVTKGKIIKQTNADGTKRYDFQFENTRGYKITVEGLSEKFNPEYWNYAKLISGVLRYRMPLEHVIKLVASLQLQSESINTWKNGVERALKKYLPGNDDMDDLGTDE